MEQTQILRQGAKTQSDMRSGAESEIQQALANFAAAVRKGDIEEIMSFYSDSLVAFDMMPPLQFTDKEAYQKNWEECFTKYFKFPVQYEYAEQKVFAHGDLAFTHALIHFVGNSKDTDQKMDNWMRGSICFRNIGDRWLIVHEHTSVPMDQEMKGLMDLKPENSVH